MLKIFLFSLVSVSQLFCVTSSTLVGNWSAYSKTNNNGTVTIEEEYLHLKANHTFTVQLLVSVKNADAFIRDLRIEASGIWKNRDNTLVIYIKALKVPFAKEIYRISQASLRQVASVFENRYKDEPLKILHIDSLTGTSLITENEKQLTTIYTRQ